MDALQMTLSRVSNWFQTSVWGPCQPFDLGNEYQTCVEPVTCVPGATNATPDMGVIGSR